MKKILLLFVLVSLATSLYASQNNLYEMFEDYYEIKIFLKDVINETENPDAKTNVFRDVFKDVVNKRINIKFIPVDREENADVIVNSKIKDYIFTEDPFPLRAVPIVMMPFVAMADTAEPKSSGKLVVDYEVRRPKDNKILFSYKHLATDKRKPKEKMTEDVAYTCALWENINRFIFKAFYKRGKR